MENNLRRKFTKEYKLQIVRLVKDEQRKPGDLEKDLGIDAAQIYRWIRIYEKNPESYLPGEGKPSEKDELRRLKKKLSNISEENKILKKALAIFSKQQNQNTK
ncbi:MAG TPA: transposase [Methanobacterium sp.]